MIRSILDYIRGFMVYGDRTYWYFHSYLKRVHFTIYGQRPGRNEEGQNFPTGRMLEVHANGKCDKPYQVETGPLYVEAVPQLDKYLV